MHYRIEVLHRVAALTARHVDYVQQHTCALDVAQEVVSQPHALARALDQTGYVGHYEALAVLTDYAQIGRKRCEMVVGDLGARRGNNRQYGRLTHIREAYQTHVGD